MVKSSIPDAVVKKSLGRSSNIFNERCLDDGVFNAIAILMFKEFEAAAWKQLVFLFSRKLKDIDSLFCFNKH